MTIRALVVDDSALMRRLISDILSKDISIEVIDTAYNGKDAIEKVLKLKPDVVTMDVEMPVMDGIEAVKQIMSTNPVPIVMLSALTSEGAETTMDALKSGAVDFICKPSGTISLNLEKIGAEIIDKVKVVSTAKVKKQKIGHGSSDGREIKILIVDNSQVIIRKLREVIDREDGLKIIGESVNGKEAIDIDLPEINGVNATFEILKKYPIPIIIFSGKTSDQMKDIKLALEIGAVDFVAKPVDQISIHTVSTLLVKKIRQAYGQKITRVKTRDDSAETENILLIGSSSGGPQTLAELIPNIPAGIPAGILIVQHMPPIFTKSLADRLNKISEIPVKEAKDGDEIIAGEALLAPGDFHMTVYEKMIKNKIKRYVSLNKDERIHGVRPAVDITFSSAANVFGPNTVGVILTGMGMDGANSMGLIKAKGGHTIAQNKETSIIFGMPDAAIKLGVVDKILPLDKIANHASQILNSIRKKEVI
jgi:two-component system chemotaxis response regulator CheB